MLCGVLAAFAAAPATVHAQSSPVKAVVKFAPAVGSDQRVAAVEDAGGRVLRVRRSAVVARMSASAADALRAAMGVVSVTIRS